MAISQNEIKLILQAQDNTSAALNNVAKGLDNIRDNLVKTTAATARYKDAQAAAAEATARYKDAQAAAATATAGLREEQAKATRQAMEFKDAQQAAREATASKSGTDAWLKTLNRVTNEVTSSMYSLQGAANNATSSITAIGQIGTQGIRAVGNAMISLLQATGNVVSFVQVMAAAIGSVVGTWIPGAQLIIGVIANLGAVAAQVFLGIAQIGVAIWREIGVAAVNTLTSIAQALIGIGGFAIQGVIGLLAGIGGVLIDAGKSVGGFVADLLNVGPAFEAATQPGNLFGEMLRNNIVAGAAFAVGMAAAKVAIDAVHDAFSFLTNAFTEYNSQIQQSTIAFTAYFQSVGKDADQAAGLAQGFLSRLQEIAATTPAEFQDLVKAAQSFVGMGLSAESTIPVLQDVINLMGAMGKSGAELPGISKALQDIFAKGRVGAQDMRQLAEHGIPAWRYLAEAEINVAKALGTVGEYGIKATDSLAQAIGKVRKASEQGAVPATAIFTAIHKAAADPRIAKAMEGINKSWAVAISNIGDRSKMLLHDMTEPIFTGLTEIMLYFGKFLDSAPVKQFAKDVGDAFRYIGTLLAPIGDVFQAALDKFNTGDISGALDTITSGFDSFAKDMFGAGWDAIKEFASGFWQGAQQLLNGVAEGAAQLVADFLVGHSPPPKGPLKEIDKAGHQLIEEYLNGMGEVPIEQVVGDIAQRVKKGMTEDASIPPISLNDAKSRVEAIQSKEAPTSNDVKEVEQIAAQVDGIIRSIADNVAEWRQEQDDVRFVIKDIKDRYEDMINPLKEQVALIQDQNKAYYEQLDLTDRLAQIQIDRQRLILQGDPVARANIEGQLELLHGKEKELSLQEKVASIEESRKNFAKEMADYQRSNASYARTVFENNLRGRPTLTASPEAPDVKKLNLAQKRLAVELQIARLEQQRDNLGDKAGLAQLKVREALLKYQSEMNRLDKEENEIKNQLTALPLIEQIKELQREEKNALEPFQDYERAIGRQIDMLQQLQNGWSRFKKDIADAAEAIKEAVKGEDPASETINESPGAKLAHRLLDGFKKFWNENFSSIIFGGIGAQIGGMFGPLGAIAGGIFGSKFGAALQADDNEWPKHLQEKVSETLSWIEVQISNVADYFGTWNAGASFGAKGIGEALSGVSGLIDALKRALSGDMPGAIASLSSAFQMFGKAIADVVVQVGAWINLPLDAQGNIFINIGKIVAKVATDIIGWIRSIISTVAEWLNIPMDNATSIWTVLGQIIPATANTIVGWITTIVTWIDNLIGKDPGSAKGLWDKIVDIWNGIVDGVGSAIETIKGLIDGLIGYKEGESKSRWDALIQTLDDVKKKVAEVFTNVVDLIARLTGADIGQSNWDTLSNIFTKVKNAVIDAVDWAKKKIQEFVDFLGDPKTAKQLTLLKDLLGGFVEQIMRFFSLGGDKTDIGQSLTDMLGIEGPKQAAPAYENFFSKLLDGFAGIMTAALDFMDVINTMGEVLIALINPIIAPFRAAYDMITEFKKALDAFSAGKYAEAAGHIVTGQMKSANDLIGGALSPFITPGVAMRGAADRIEERHRKLDDSRAAQAAEDAKRRQKMVSDATREAAVTAQKAQERTQKALDAINPAASAAEATRQSIPDVTKAAEDAGRAASDGLEKGSQGTPAAANAAMENAARGVAQWQGPFSDQGIGLGVAATQGFATGIDQGKANIDGSVSMAANVAWQHTDEYQETGKRLGVALVLGLAENIVASQDVDTGVSNVAYVIWQHTAEFQETGARLGAALDQGIMQGMDDNLDQMVIAGSAARTLEALWKLAEEKFCPTGEHAGEIWIQCLGNGIDANRDQDVIDGAAARVLEALWKLADEKFFPTGLHDGERWVAGFVQGVDDNRDQEIIDGAIARVLEAIWRLADSSFYPTGAHLGEALVRGIRDSIDEGTKDIEGAVLRALYAIFSLAPNFEETGKRLGTAFSLGLMNTLDAQIKDIVGAVQRILYEIWQLQENFRKTGEASGNAFMAGLLGALAQGVQSAGAAGGLIGAALLAGLLNQVQGAYGAGQAVGEGFGGGVAASGEGASNAGTTLSAEVLAAIDSGLGIASPSKEAITRGRQIAIGLAQGINADPVVAKNIGVIIREALNANVDPLIALALAKVESGFNASKPGDNGHSVGLFQLHDQGAGAGMSVAQRQDPSVNAQTFFQREAKTIAAAIATGLKGEALAVEVGKRAERPLQGTEGKYGQAYRELMGILMQSGRQGGGAVATLQPGGAYGPPPAATGGPGVRGARLANNFNIVDQLTLPGLSAQQAVAACGPAAAMAFARAVGRNPTAQEAMAIAQQIGWTQDMGMPGSDSFMELAQRLGAKTQKMPATQENINAQLAAGRPFAVSTPEHYFQVAGGQQGAGGKLNVGKSGTVYRQGKEQMTLAEMEAVAGQAQSLIVLMGDVSDTSITASNAAADAVSGTAQTQTASINMIQEALQALIIQYEQTGQVSKEEANNLLRNAQNVTGTFQNITSALGAGVAPPAGAGALDPTRRPVPGIGLQDPGRDIKGDLGSTIGIPSVVAAGKAAAEAVKPMTAFVQAVAALRPQIEAGAVAGMGLQEQIVNLAASTKMAEEPLRRLQAGTESTEAAMADIIKTSQGMSTDFLDLWNRLRDGKVNIQDATNQFFNLLSVFKETPQAAQAAAAAIAAATARANAAPKPGEIRRGVQPRGAMPAGTRTPAPPPGTIEDSWGPGGNMYPPGQRRPYVPPYQPPGSIESANRAGSLATGLLTPKPLAKPPGLADATGQYLQAIEDTKKKVLEDMADVQKILAASAQKITLPKDEEWLNADIEKMIPSDLSPEAKKELTAYFVRIQDYMKSLAASGHPTMVSPNDPRIMTEVNLKDPNLANWQPGQRDPYAGTGPKGTSGTRPYWEMPPSWQAANPPGPNAVRPPTGQKGPGGSVADIPVPNPRTSEAAGTAVTQGVATGIQKGLPDIQQSLAMITDQLGALNATLQQVAVQLADGVTVGMQAVVGAIQTAQVAAGAEAEALGNSITQGFYNAIQKIYDAVPVAQDAVKQLLAAMASEAEVASPSKKSEKIGGEIATGLVKGYAEQLAQLDAIARQVTAQFLGTALDSKAFGEQVWAIEKPLLELTIRKAQEEAKLIPIHKEISQLTREIAATEKGSLADRLRLVQIEGRRMQIELAQIQAQKKLREEFGADQERIEKRGLELAAALAAAELARVPIQIQIKNLQQDIEAIQRGSLEDQLKVFDLETERMQLNLQQSQAQQAINSQFKDLLGMEQRLAQLATQRAKADLSILPTRQRLAAVDRQIEKTQKGSLTEQIADIRRDETRTKNKIRQLAIEKELGKLRSSSALEGDALFEANAKRFGLQDTTTSLTGDRVGALEQELQSIQDQNDQLDKQEEMQKLLRDLAVISDRITKATLEDAIQQHDALYQKMYDETELLQAQKALREAEKAELEAMLLGPIKQRQEELGLEIDIIKQRNELAARGRERELLLLQEQLRQMELSSRAMQDEKTLLDAQKAALDALVALREYQVTGPLKKELELLDEEAKIIDLQNKLRAQPQKERLTQLEYEEEIQSKMLHDIEDQLEALQKQKAVYDAIKALIDAIAEKTILPGEGDTTKPPGSGDGGGAGGKTPKSSSGTVFDPGRIKEAETAVHNLGVALEHLSNGNYVLAIDDVEIGLSQSQLEDLQRQLELLSSDAAGKIVIDGKEIQLTAEQIGKLKEVLGTLPEGIDLKVDDATLVRVATQDIPGLKTQLESVATTGGVVNINGQNITLTQEQVQNLINQINGIKNTPAVVNVNPPDVTATEAAIAGIQAELLRLEATITSPTITADDMAAAQAAIATLRAELEALTIFKANPTVDLNDPNAIAARIETLQQALDVLNQTVTSPDVTTEDMAAAQEKIASIQRELLALGLLVAKPTGDPSGLAPLEASAQSAKKAVDAIDDTPIVPVVNEENLKQLVKDAQSVDDGIHQAFTEDPVDPEFNAASMDSFKGSADQLNSWMESNFDNDPTKVAVDMQSLSQAAESAKALRQYLDDVMVDRNIKVNVTTTGKNDLDSLRSYLDWFVTHSNINVRVSASTPTTPGRVGGGRVDPKAYVVGERGPELFVPWTNGHVIPNGRSMKMLKDSGYEGRAGGGAVISGAIAGEENLDPGTRALRGGVRAITGAFVTGAKALGSAIKAAIDYRPNWLGQLPDYQPDVTITPIWPDPIAPPPVPVPVMLGPTLPDPVVPENAIPPQIMPVTADTTSATTLVQGLETVVTTPQAMPVGADTTMATTAVGGLVTDVKVPEIMPIGADTTGAQSAISGTIQIAITPQTMPITASVNQTAIQAAIQVAQQPRTMPIVINVNEQQLQQLVQWLGQNFTLVVRVIVDANEAQATINALVQNRTATLTVRVQYDDPGFTPRAGGGPARTPTPVPPTPVQVPPHTPPVAAPPVPQLPPHDPVEPTVPDPLPEPPPLPDPEPVPPTPEPTTPDPPPTRQRRVVSQVFFRGKWYIEYDDGTKEVRDAPPGLAAGGRSNQSQLYLVGERGPELFVPSTNGMVLPSHMTQRILGAMQPRNQGMLNRDAATYATARANGGMVFGGPNSVVANNPTGISNGSVTNKTTNLTVNYNYYGRKEISGQSELADVVRDAVRYSESMG